MAQHAQRETVRQFILDGLEKHPADIVRVAAEHFGYFRQAIHRHLKRLVAEGVVAQTGHGRQATYHLAQKTSWRKTYAITEALAEDVVWRTDIAQWMATFPRNVIHIWQYASPKCSTTRWSTRTVRP